MLKIQLLVFFLMNAASIQAQEPDTTTECWHESCPSGKVEGDEWNELGESGERETFKYRCENGCGIFRGCITVLGTLIGNGVNITEYYYDEQCDVFATCLAVKTAESTGLHFTSKGYCGNSTINPRSTTGTTEFVTSTSEESITTTESIITTQSMTPVETTPTLEPTRTTAELTFTTTESAPTTDPLDKCFHKSCPAGKIEEEEWNESGGGTGYTEREFFKYRCKNGCGVFLGCITDLGTLIGSGVNISEYYDERCDIRATCLPEETNGRIHHRFISIGYCDGATINPPSTTTTSEITTPTSEHSTTTTEPKIIITDSTFSDSTAASDEPTPTTSESKSTTTETIATTPESTTTSSGPITREPCSKDRKEGEKWDHGRFTKECSTFPGEGLFVKIVGCISTTEKFHIPKGFNHTEIQLNGCSRSTYCLRDGEKTVVIDGELICPTEVPNLSENAIARRNTKLSEHKQL